MKMLGASFSGFYHQVTGNYIVTGRVVRQSEAAVPSLGNIVDALAIRRRFG